MDHPRSRGVYRQIETMGLSHQGSSPLARGLRRAQFAVGPLTGIIPARAGFTALPREGGRRFEDHPRSRGVYLIGGGEKIRNLGSSPLARGLRVIHPARIVVGMDHPRSRGVYPVPVLFGRF